jgi:Pentapeptide repeats (8 copies)
MEFSPVSPVFTSNSVTTCVELMTNREGVDFVGVDFVGVDFVGVDFVGVDFVGVDFSLSGVSEASDKSDESLFFRP